MPADLSVELARLVTAGGIVGTVAVPLGLVGYGASRLLGQPVWPRWRHTTGAWTGLDVLFFCGVYLVLPSLIVAGLDRGGFFQSIYGPDFPSVTTPGEGTDGRAVAVQKAGLWGVLFAAPMLAGATLLVRAVIHHRPARFVPAAVPGRVTLGVMAWVAVTPVCFAVNLLANRLVALTGGEPDQHPLTRLGVGSDAFDQVLFGLVVCLAAPLAEEVLCRGVLLRWALARYYRPWLLLTLAIPIGLARGGPPPAVFALLLAGGWWLVVALDRGRLPIRTLAAVVATSSVFAVGHGGVWPTPVPLFVLGLALGYLAARTGDITACIVLHGLFNAVSFVYLLRGGAGA
ncbi:MAG: CPBP family intramembrane glutamic endopeptidase [Gemmataceae bacterium]